MSDRLMGVQHFARAIFVIALTVVLIAMTAFSAGSTPVNGDSVATSPDLIAEPEESIENDTLPLEEPLSDSENSFIFEDPEAMQGVPEDNLGLDANIPEPTGMETLLQSLDQLNAAISPLATGDGRTCSYAAPGGTGLYAGTLCWFDFSQAARPGSTGVGFTTRYRDRGRGQVPRYVSVMDPLNGPFEYTDWNSQVINGGDIWGNIKNFPVKVNLGGGYELEAMLSVTGANASGTGANASGKALEARAFPTYTQAFLGNSGFYSGVAGMPALYQRIEGAGNAKAITTVKLSGIVLKKGDQEIKDYSIVVADAESTDSGERIDWNATGPGFRWLPNKLPANTKAQVMGNACPGGISPAYNSTTPSKTASCAANSSSTKNGTPMLAATPPLTTESFDISQQMTGSGLQGVSFGVITARTAVEASVEKRIVDSANIENDRTNFSAQVVTTDSTVVASTETGETNLVSPEAASAIPVSSGGTRLSFSSATTGNLDSSYVPTWTCKKEDPNSASPILWPDGGGASPTPPGVSDEIANLKVGEFLKCTVTYKPPYLTLAKVVDNGATAARNVASDFDLKAAGLTSVISGRHVATTSVVSKRPVATGDYILSETVPDVQVGDNWRYGYDWKDLVCIPTLNANSTSVAAVEKTMGENDIVTEGKLKIATGNDVTCTYKNVAREPKLEVAKQTFNKAGTGEITSGESVNSGDIIAYKLTFKNEGTASMELDHRDYLGDILDDAAFVSGSIKISDGDETGYPAVSLDNSGVSISDNTADTNPHLGISGSVDRKQTRTVWFQVTIKPNEDNAQGRQTGKNRPVSNTTTTNQVGYSLNNYLLPAGIDIPEKCEISAPPVNLDSACTHHKINAWTIRKDSQPQDGAMIHSGGNIYYRVKVTNYSGKDLTGVQILDNMTETLAATVWDPNAPLAVPVHYGISFYDMAGNEIPGLAQPWDAEESDAPQPIFTGDQNFDEARPGGLAFPDGEWWLTTPKFNIPAEHNGIAVSHAIVGYAVKGGSVADPANPRQPYKVEGSNLAALPNAIWVNTVQAEAATVEEQTLPPNRCSSEGGDLPGGDVPGYYDCKVWHSLSDNYFHLWKKSAAEGPDGKDVGLNLINSSFVLADTYQDAIEGKHSRWLCRTNNNPYLADYVAPGSDPAISGDLDFGRDSSTWLAIRAWNQDPGNIDNQKEACGIFFHLDEDDQGQAAGSWRAMDIRGGDTVEGSSTPLQDWRTNSALNEPADPDSGRHGTYWVVETKSPQDYQLLSAPFKMWVAPNSPTPETVTFGPGNAGWYDYQGRLSLPVVGKGESSSGKTPMVGESIGGEDLRWQCITPWVLPPNNQPNCVMPTGWTMPIFDVKLQALPLTGGSSNWLPLQGFLLLAVTFLGSLLWRSKKKATAHRFGGEKRM